MYTTRQKQIDKMILAAAILAAGLVATDAKSDPVATSGNSAGGVIVLTDDYIPACGEQRRLAYTTNPRGFTVYGCWMTDKILVHIIWGDSGQIRSYPINHFVAVGPKV